MNLEQLKSELAKQEKALANPKLFALMGDKIQAKIDGLKKQISDMESVANEKVEDAEKKIDEAEKKVEQAETKEEKKEAQAELKEAKEEKKEAVAEVKEVEAVADKIEKVEKKAEEKAEAVVRDGKRRVGRPRIEKMPVIKGKHGGKRVGAGRKKKATSAKRIVKPKKYKPSSTKPVFVRKAKPAVVKEKVKTLRVFGQTVEYKNDTEFCSKLIKAFKKRRSVYKKSKKKTRPVFGIITSKIKDAVTKAIDNTPKKQIESNPKAFLAKAQRLEKSAIKFLEDFKAILGSDYKKSEISAEFGELEKSIKKMVAKYK